ncbi:MAG: hypothetical protein Q9162_002617 [Coniocarpon cinnabarinum]
MNYANSSGQTSNVPSAPTDVIKSRNRVKNPAGPPSTAIVGQDSSGAANGQQVINGAAAPKQFSGVSLAAAHPDVASNPNHYERLAQQTTNIQPDAHLQPPSHHLGPIAASQPNSRSTTPSNIAPSHLFESSLIDTSNVSGITPPPGTTVPLANMRSMTPSLLQDGDNGISIQALIRTNGELKTRVAELEVIQDLYRSRVSELEESEDASRKRAEALEQELQQLKSTAEELRGSSSKRRAEEEALEDLAFPEPKRTRLLDSDVNDEAASLLTSHSDTVDTLA